MSFTPIRTSRITLKEIIENKMQDIAWKQILTFGGIGLALGLVVGTFVVAPMLKKKDKDKPASSTD